MLGLTKREITRRFDEIVEFAEIEDFIDAPVKTYSSGMYMRLGFAVAINVDPDVLLVDEVLAVGDEGFTHKCLDKFAEFKRRGKTILLVTHSLGLVERFCDEALWLDAGRVKGLGDPQARRRRLHHRRRGQRGAAARRRRRAGAGDRGCGIVSPDEPVSRRAARQPDRDRDGARRHVPRRRRAMGLARGRDHRRAARGRGRRSRAISFTSGARARRAHRPARAAAGRRLRRSASASSTPKASAATARTPSIEDLAPQRLAGDVSAIFSIESLDLVEGTYKLDVAVHRLDGYPYDYHRLLYTFRVKSRTKDVGIYRPEARLAFSPETSRSRQIDGTIVNLLDALVAHDGTSRRARAAARARDRLHQRRVRPAASRATCAISRPPARMATCSSSG